MAKNRSNLMKVCYFGTYREEYSRNRIMIAGLKKAGVDVFECHESLWLGIDDRIKAASGGWTNPSFIFRIIKVYIRLFLRGIRLPEYDVMICGYPGHFDVFLARIITFLRHRPLVWDVFMSIYLISIERKLDKIHHFTISLLRFFEYHALRLPDLLIMDTQEYVEWLRKKYNLSANRFRLVPTGADDQVFGNHEINDPDLAKTFLVLYYGTFIPNHGVPYIIQATNYLKENREVIFELIGEGPELSKCQELVKDLGLTNVSFLPWMSQVDLVQHINQAGVILGAFGKTPQSLMTIQNKIFEGLAMGKAVISGDSPTVRAAFCHGDSIWLCDRDNPESLALAVKKLSADSGLRSRIACKGNELFWENYSVGKIGERFQGHLDYILN